MGKAINELKRIHRELEELIRFRRNGVAEYEMDELRSTIGVNLFYSNDVAIQMAFCEKGRFPSHSHDEIEHLIIVRGKAVYEDDNKTVELTVGDSVYIPPQTRHCVEFTENSKVIGVTIPANVGYPKPPVNDNE